MRATKEAGMWVQKKWELTSWGRGEAVQRRTRGAKIAWSAQNKKMPQGSPSELQ